MSVYTVRLYASSRFNGDTYTTLDHLDRIMVDVESKAIALACASSPLFKGRFSWVLTPNGYTRDLLYLPLLNRTSRVRAARIIEL